MLAGIALFLSGCGPSPSQDVATCQIDAFRTYIDGPQPYWTRFIKMCMQARGYEWVPLKDERCAPSAGSNDSLYTIPQCYRRDSVLGRLIWYAQKQDY